MQRSHPRYIGLLAVDNRSGGRNEREREKTEEKREEGREGGRERRSE